MESGGNGGDLLPASTLSNARHSFPPSPPSLQHVPTGELIKQALDDARELVRIEVGLAKDEARAEVQAFKQAAIAGAIALVAALLVLSTATIALIFAIAHTAHASGIALAVAAVYLALAGGMGWVAYRRLPKAVAPNVRKQIESDVEQIKGLIRRSEPPRSGVAKGEPPKSDFAKGERHPS